MSERPPPHPILREASGSGAFLAGIVSSAALRPTFAHGQPEPLREPGSLLVLALGHPESQPELDWWDDRPGGSPGNRILEEKGRGLIPWLRKEMGVEGELLPYNPERGGVLLKDAAVLAGLGTIGANNLLITPEYGPRVRLRALLLRENLESTGPIGFSPCEGCDTPCRKACPQAAFRDGVYNRTRCMKQMKADETNKALSRRQERPVRVIRYCRACETACPIGNAS